MAKSPRNGQTRVRRAADRRQAPEELAVQNVTPASADDYSAVAAAAEAARHGHPSREQIARRAYELYLARGGSHGYDIEDWLRAERELRGQ